MDKLIVTQWRGRVCMAISSKSGTTQVMMEPEDSSPLPNNIYIGKAQKVVGNINAAFMDIGDGRTGYYSLDENKEHIFVLQSTGRPKAGDEIVIQVSRDVAKTKTPVLTGKLAFIGRYCVLTVEKTEVGFSVKIGDNGYKARIKAVLREALSGEGESFSVVVWANGAGVTDEVLLEEYEHLENLYCKLAVEAFCRTCHSCIYRVAPGYTSTIRGSYSDILDGITTGIPGYHRELKAYLEQYQTEDAGRLSFYEDRLLPLTKLYSIDTVVERALDKHMWLKSGGYLVVEPTEVMVMIDINTGKYARKKNMRETICKVNMGAAEEIGRRLRLRNLSGIILIDSIDMEQGEDREVLMCHPGEMVSKDPVKTTVMDMTRPNLVEITRKKVRKPLYEQVLPPSNKIQ